MGFASCANLSQAADLLARRDEMRRPNEIGQKGVKCKLDKKSLCHVAAKKQSKKKRRRAEKSGKWRSEAQLLKDIRKDIALAHHMTGGPRPSEAAFRVHFQMKAATNFKVDYVCRSHLACLLLSLSLSLSLLLPRHLARSLSAAACPGHVLALRFAT